MAKKATGAKTVSTATEVPKMPKRKRAGVAVRLDIPKADHDRATRIAREQGLSLASFARMSLYRAMKEAEGGSK